MLTLASSQIWSQFSTCTFLDTNFARFHLFSVKILKIQRQLFGGNFPAFFFLYISHLLSRNVPQSHGSIFKWIIIFQLKQKFSFCTSPNFALLTFSWFWVGKMHRNCLKVPRSGFGVCWIQWEWFQVDNFSSFWDITRFPVFLLKNETVEFWILAQKLCRTIGT